MITIDNRIGSKEFLPLFPPGSAKLGSLQYGDFMFVGNGPEGIPVGVGVERKQVREIAGTILDGRLVGHQLPGLLASYHTSYLVVEGRWRCGHSGLLEEKRGKDWRTVEVGTRRFMATDLIKFLTTLELMAGIKVRKTEDKKATVVEVLGIHSWWTGKRWEDHSSHLAIPSPHLETTSFIKASLLQDLAFRLPGIGWKRSLAVEAHFGSIRGMFNAEEKEWREIEGVGKEMARRIVEAIRWERKKG